MILLTFFLFSHLLTRRIVSPSAPRGHSCEQTSGNCSGLNLTRVPAAPTKVIAELDLSFNRLGTITERDFIAYPGLHVLLLNNNIIKVIQKRAFVPLAYLVKLDLSFNQLDVLCVDWFQNLLSLQHLNLLGNRYKMLGRGNLFKPLKRLKTLHFGGPYLQSVRKSDFSGLGALEEVFFSGPNLESYAEGSLRQIMPLRSVTLGLSGPFWRNQTVVEAILSDVSHPKTTLTLTETFFQTENHMSPFNVVSHGGTTSLVFKNINITEGACMALFKRLSDSNITVFAMEDAKFFLGNVLGFKYSRMMHLDEIFLRNIDISQFYSFPALFFLLPVLRELRKMSVLSCNLFVIPCEFSAYLSKLEYLDLGGNIMSDMTLEQMLCNGRGAFSNLQTLNVSRNNLRSIDSRLFTNLHRLETVDLSGNVFHGIPDTCYWPPSLQFLNLTSTHLRKVTPCLPTTLRVLDVSDNALTAFTLDLPSLRDLYISGNKLHSLPQGSLYPRLTFLSIRNNDLHTLSNGHLSDYRDLKSLQAGANTYVCSCDFVAFMTCGLTRHAVTLGDPLKSYVCHSPDVTRGKSVTDARLSVFECHTVVAFSLLCAGILVVILLTAGLCHRYSVMWYVRMTWVWLRAKRKPKLKKGALEYDAFVSYSEMDSGWVEAHLVPELEQTEPPIRLCLHKRDFIAGGWILDNIMDAIEKSHRTLFVLSRHFVRSEWCKYELDYTHFRLFDQNDDTVVLILLEPIDKNAIPKKFCRLRRVMNSRTYLEWPDDDNQISRFWQSLRTAITRPDTHDETGVNQLLDL